MNKTVKPILIILCLTTLVACATQPLQVELADHVPEKRIISSEHLVASTDSGTIVVVRENGFMGTGCTTKISANEKIIADLAIGEKLVLHLDEGEHTLSAWPNGICSGVYAEQTIAVKKSQKLTCRIGYNRNGDFYLSRPAM